MNYLKLLLILFITASCAPISVTAPQIPSPSLQTQTAQKAEQPVERSRSAVKPTTPRIVQVEEVRKYPKSEGYVVEVKVRVTGSSLTGITIGATGTISPTAGPESGRIVIPVSVSTSKGMKNAPGAGKAQITSQPANGEVSAVLKTLWPYAKLGRAGAKVSLVMSLSDSKAAPIARELFLPPPPPPSLPMR